MFKSILMVCVGNICRSPMAEYYFREQFRKRGIDITVSSAGIGALVGKGADPYTLDILTEQGIDASSHVARQITTSIVAEHELILVMESWQQKELEKIIQVARGRVHTIGKWGNFEIPDPYRKPKEVFEQTFENICEGYRQWVQKTGL